MALDITRLSGGNTPADGSDPRTFPAIWNSTATALEGLELDDLTGVTVTSPTTGQVLEYNGSAWVNVEQQPGDNLIYNGAMQVAQRGTSETGITGPGYSTADRWRSDISSMGTWTQTVESDGPTGSGFAKSLKMECTTADGSPAASDYVNVQQRFEGQDLQGLKKGTSSAESLTLSFWVKSNATGTYVVEFLDLDNNRHISAAYTIVSSGTWEQKTVTLPGDTGGSGFTNDNGLSLLTVFWLGVGSDRSSGTLATSWAARDNANSAVGQTNLAASTSNYWQVTGVQLEAGTVATPFEHKSYGVELAECKRYYQKSFLYDTAPFNNTIANTVTIGNPATTAGYGTTSGLSYSPGFSILEVEMRSTPSVQLYSANGNVSAGQFGDVYNKNNTTSYAASVITDSNYGNYTNNKRISVRTNNGSGVSNQGNPLGVHWTADAEL